MSYIKILADETKEPSHLDSCFLETLLEFHFIALVKLQQDITQLNLNKQNSSKTEAKTIRNCNVREDQIDSENSCISYHIVQVQRTYLSGF